MTARSRLTGLVIDNAMEYFAEGEANDLLRSVVVLGGFHLVKEELRFASAPVLFEPHHCINYGVAMLVSNAYGLGRKLAICPYMADRQESALRYVVTKYKDAVNGTDMHLFLDSRGSRGQPMKYCCRGHQKADFMRRVRRHQRQRKSK
jgi:hypothetical protein